MTAVAERLESLVEAFDAFRREKAFGTDRTRQQREAAFARFLARGFPSTRDEEWRFTNVAPVAAMRFVRPSAPALDRATVDALVHGATARIVIVNGRLSPQQSTLDALPAGVTVSASANITDGPAVSGGAFVDLNDAFFEDLVIIRVAEKTVVSQPLFLLAIGSGDAQPVMVAPRVAVVVGDGAEVSIVESYATVGAAAVLTSAVTSFQLGAGATVDHVKVQTESDAAFHLATSHVRLQRASTFTSRALTFGGRISRNDITSVLDGEGAECTLNGLYIATGDTLVDTHTTIDHAKPHCPSHEVYKGILAGKSRAVFNGKIIVRQDAQKTNAKQTNKALLLTDDAQINTKPQLEIFADDVKCTHGAAIGQLDEDAMFYLRARGISVESARNMMIHAFAGDVLNGIRVDAVREAAVTLMEQKLRLSHEV